MSHYPAITWITAGSDCNDYRPAVSANGATLVFERTYFELTTEGKVPGTTVLYQVSMQSGLAPAPLLPNMSNAQTRPDWCWPTNQIAFNEGGNPIMVSVLNMNTNEVVPVNNTNNYIYPQWNAIGTTLTVMNQHKKTAHPVPCSTIITTSGVITNANINGNITDGLAVFGGMPAVDPLNSQLIAFAGQPVQPPWGKAAEEAVYNQEYNYIFFNSVTDNVFSSVPMEVDASLIVFDPAFQGRAPAWSPNGRYIVFESTRNGGQFALFLFDTQNNNSPVQITDTVYQAQHAKFFANGTQLVFCGRPQPGSYNGIGLLDISGLVA
jgi:Tol biopolymer transport system component